MADETPDEVEAVDEATTKKKKVPAVMLLALLEIIAGIAFVYMFLPSTTVEPGAEAWKEGTTPRVRVVPDIIVNLNEPSGRRILRFTAHISYISSEETTEAVDAAMNKEGAVEHILVGILTKKSVREVRGRPDSIIEELIAALNQQLFISPGAGGEPIEQAEVVQVLLPQWIMQ